MKGTKVSLDKRNDRDVGIEQKKKTKLSVEKKKDTEVNL